MAPPLQLSALLASSDFAAGEGHQDRARMMGGGQVFPAGGGFDLLTGAEQGSACRYGLVSPLPEVARNVLTPRFDVGDRAAAIAPSPPAGSGCIQPPAGKQLRSTPGIAPSGLAPAPAEAELAELARLRKRFRAHRIFHEARGAAGIRHLAYRAVAGAQPHTIITDDLTGLRDELEQAAAEDHG